MKKKELEVLLDNIEQFCTEREERELNYKGHLANDLYLEFITKEEFDEAIVDSYFEMEPIHIISAMIRGAKNENA